MEGAVVRSDFDVAEFCNIKMRSLTPIIRYTSQCSMLMGRRQALSAYLVRSRFTMLALAMTLLAVRVVDASPVLAIPEELAIKKFEVVPVFVLVDGRGIPMSIAQDKTLLVPLYLDSQQANSRLSEVRNQVASSNASVVAIPLPVIIDKINKLNLQLRDKSMPMVGVVYGSQVDRERAVAMLRSSGLTDNQISRGLTIPVFFTRPSLIMQTSQGRRAVFYMSYQDLQKGISALSLADRSRVEPQVADINALLREMVQAKDDNFVIYPTSEYFRLVQDTQNQAKPTAGTGAAPAPASR